ncbi:MAG: NAD-dependent succinate-semialdehyde dehydrogenase [Sandaracinaceae bacterium]
MSAPVLTAVDPTTGRTVREVPVASDADVDATLERAHACFAEWRDRSFDERAAVLTRVAAIMRDDTDTLGYLMTEEMGKPVKEARGEVQKSALTCDHYAANAARYLEVRLVESDATRSYVQHLPLGVVLGILPWNAPFWLAFRFCAPTLMAGNTCVIKHDPHVPGCAEAIAEVFARAGAPQGLLQNLPLETARVERVIRDPRVRAVSFTGSDRGGAIVASVAGSEIKPAVLELGGSDPCIVLRDADLDRAADVICLSRIINAGQSCIAAKRILVEEHVYAPLLERLEARLDALKVGDPREPATDVGPIARDDLRRELHRQVRTSVEAGAELRLGGELPRGDGFFYPVTLLADVPEGAPAMKEETFGPVAVVSKVTDAEHALRVANRTPYGLGASIWSADVPRADAMARRIDTGQVSVNGIVKTDPRLPSGGVKRSGFGRELGREGIHAFVNAQQVWVGPAR